MFKKSSLRGIEKFRGRQRPVLVLVVGPLVNETIWRVAEGSNRRTGHHHLPGHLSIAKVRFLAVRWMPQIKYPI